MGFNDSGCAVAEQTRSETLDRFVEYCGLFGLFGVFEMEQKPEVPKKKNDVVHRDNNQV
jgi:hypothetical protein